MYKGVDFVKYTEISNYDFTNMNWDIGKGSSYGETLRFFLNKSIMGNKIIIDSIFGLLEHIFENIHDHGSGNCKLIYGKLNDSLVFEVYDEDGGFDIKKLPYGKGGAGYRAIKDSDWIISHSADGKHTFLVFNKS